MICSVVVFIASIGQRLVSLSRVTFDLCLAESGHVETVSIVTGPLRWTTRSVIVLSRLSWLSLVLPFLLSSAFFCFLGSWLRHRVTKHTRRVLTNRVEARSNLIYVQHQGQIIEVHSAIGRRLTLDCCCWQAALHLSELALKWTPAWQIGS